MIRLVLDDVYSDVLCELVRKAKRSVDILSFSFAIGSAAGKINFGSEPYRIAEAIAKAKRKLGNKLRIRLYIEGLRETALRNHITAEFLREHGVEVRYGSTHAKGFCIDGKTLLFGSTNLTNQSLLKNRETNVLFTATKAAAQFERYFEFLWEGGGHGGIHLQRPFFADGDFKDAMIDKIDSAESRLDFSIYFFDQAEIEKAFLRAHRRGVRISGLFADHRAFALSYVHRTKATARRMSRAGIERLYLGDPSTFTHSKYLIIDRKEIFIGTGNWLDEDVEIHPQLYLEVKNPTLATKLALILERQNRANRSVSG